MKPVKAMVSRMVRKPRVNARRAGATPNDIYQVGEGKGFE